MRDATAPLTLSHADFEALYERHSREVWALVYARWLNADLALDMTQEAFLRLWKQWGAGATVHDPRAWLLRVARNLAEDHAKSAFRRNGTHPPQTMNGVPARQLPPRHSLRRSRLALAASVLLLLVSQIGITGHFRDVPSAAVDPAAGKLAATRRHPQHLPKMPTEAPRPLADPSMSK